MPFDKKGLKEKYPLYIDPEEVFGKEEGRDVKGTKVPLNYHAPPPGGPGVCHYDELGVSPYPFREPGSVLREMFGEAVGEWDGF